MKDRFYLEKLYPNPDSIFAFKPKTLDEIKDTCIFVFDANILLIPYFISQNSVANYAEIFRKLATENRIYIPARAAREFIKNRGQKIADIFGKIVESTQSLNNAKIRLDDFPIFEADSNYISLKDIEGQINRLKEQYRRQLEALSQKLKTWNWTDPVSELYRETFNANTIINLQEDEAKLSEKLDYRFEHLIAPGFKASDQKKPDDGIGDLINWQTTLEIGRDKNIDVVFVTEESQNDWFYRQQKTSVLPKYELIEEFKNFTNGKTICIIDFSDFLQSQNATPSTIEEVKEIKIETPLVESIQQQDSTGYKIISEDDFMKQLSILEHENLQKGGFVGAKYFIETYLAELGFDIGKSWEMYKKLQNIKFENYKWEDPKGQYYPLNAIRLKK